MSCNPQTLVTVKDILPVTLPQVLLRFLNPLVGAGCFSDCEGQVGSCTRGSPPKSDDRYGSFPSLSVHFSQLIRGTILLRVFAQYAVFVPSVLFSFQVGARLSSNQLVPSRPNLFQFDLDLSLRSSRISLDEPVLVRLCCVPTLQTDLFAVAAEYKRCWGAKQGQQSWHH